MRGAVSPGGRARDPARDRRRCVAFPERDLVIFLAFCVILATLVGQGLLFPPLIRALRIEDDTSDADEELDARLEIAYAALDQVDELEGEDWVIHRPSSAPATLYDYRTPALQSSIDGSPLTTTSDDDFDYEARADSLPPLHARGVSAAQRATLRAAARPRATSTDEVRRRVEYDLDLEEARLTS